MSAPRWTTEAQVEAAERGIELAEVIDVLYGEQLLRNDLGDVIYTCAPAGTGRFVTVTTERLARPLVTEWITRVRLSNRGEIAAWKKEFGHG